MMRPVFRFAPSPNGALHLGHAYSVLLNAQMAHESGGRLLLRIEDIDTTRCSIAFEEEIRRDLSWLGVAWEEPVRRQSQHLDDYVGALEELIDADLVYPSFLSRGEAHAIIAIAEDEGREWPHDPEGRPLFPTLERELSDAVRQQRIADGEPYAWRLNVDAAMAYLEGSSARAVFWEETGAGPNGETGHVEACPSDWGDVVLARKELPTSYHLSVTIDDALQGVTHVVRGRDLYYATAIQRLLQQLLGLPQPIYHHHDLIVNDDGRKLSKSRHDVSLCSLRAAGLIPADIVRMIGM